MAGWLQDLLSQVVVGNMAEVAGMTVSQDLGYLVVREGMENPLKAH